MKTNTIKSYLLYIMIWVSGYLFHAFNADQTAHHHSDFKNADAGNKQRNNRPVAQNNTKNKNSSKPWTLPTVLIAGTQKGATTALSNWLSHSNKNNSGICQARIFRGEPFFFNKEVHFFSNDKRYNQGKEFYEKRYQHCHNDANTTKNRDGIPLTLDATPENMREPQRIFETYQKAGQLDSLKIIFSLREPISRDLSWYNHMKALELKGEPRHRINDVINRTYDQYAEDITIPGILGKRRTDTGLYSKFLSTWFEIFPRKQMLVLSFDEIQNDPAKVRERVEKFLNAEFPLNESGNNWVVSNSQSYEGKVRQPSCETQEKLAVLFEPYNEELYELLDSTEVNAPEMQERPFPRFELGPCTP